MSTLLTQIRPGAYADSILLMQLQSDLQKLDGVLKAGVVMGTEINLELLRSSQLLDGGAEAAGANDLVIAVRARSKEQANRALEQIDELLQSKSSAPARGYRPRSLATALELLPDGSWVSVSTPGRYAGTLAREALEHGSSVFIYSDNVTVAEELEIKTRAASLGRLIMGPDCGTAEIGGVGFGFVNRVRPGPIGLIGASGTGLQSISSRIHHLKSGISHVIGTGGRDLSDEIGGLTSRQALSLLARDPHTQVIVLASKPPGSGVSSEILSAALHTAKPVVVFFSGYAAPAPRVANIHFARSSTEAAELAVSALGAIDEPSAPIARTSGAPASGYLRGLFAGGTLALEVLQGVGPFLSPLYSNLDTAVGEALVDPTRSLGHTILDLGADELTLGRLHPMIDPQLRLDRMRQEAADPDTGLILFDVILGRGSHPDPAAGLASVIADIRAADGPPCMGIVVGTDEDPQDLKATLDRLGQAGASVVRSPTEALHDVVRLCGRPASSAPLLVSLDVLQRPESVINIGLETFFDELIDQDVAVVQVDWRPPAAGNERLMSILERMKS